LLNRWELIELLFIGFSKNKNDQFKQLQFPTLTHAGEEEKIELKKWHEQMKWKVNLFVGGHTFDEYCYAENRKGAIETAKARNPTARVIGTNVVFTQTFKVVDQ